VLESNINVSVSTLFHIFILAVLLSVIYIVSFWLTIYKNRLYRNRRFGC